MPAVMPFVLSEVNKPLSSPSVDRLCNELTLISVNAKIIGRFSPFLMSAIGH